MLLSLDNEQPASVLKVHEYKSGTVIDTYRATKKEGGKGGEEEEQ